MIKFILVVVLLLFFVFLDSSPSPSSSSSLLALAFPDKIFPYPISATTFCPRASTVEGVWGLSKRRYNTLSFYNETRKFWPRHVIGKWIRISPRQIMMKRVCRRYQYLINVSGGSSSLQQVKTMSDCEWGPKPSQFFPFMHDVLRKPYWLNETAVIYMSHQTIAKLLENPEQQHQLENGKGTTSGKQGREKSRNSYYYNAESQNKLELQKKRLKLMEEDEKTAKKEEEKRKKDDKNLKEDDEDEKEEEDRDGKQNGEMNWCYDFQDASQCLRGKVIVMFGDSHIVQFSEALCRMALKHANVHHTYPAFQNVSGEKQLRGPCGSMDIRYSKHVTVAHIPFHLFPSSASSSSSSPSSSHSSSSSSPSSPSTTPMNYSSAYLLRRDPNTITIALLRVRYNLKTQFHRFEEHRLAKELKRRADFVVINRGMWDVTFRDTPRQIVASEFAESLKFLSETFPRAKIIVKLPHYDHLFMWNCSAPKRMRELRDANICAAYFAWKSSVDQQRVRTSGIRKQLESAYTLDKQKLVESYHTSGLSDPVLEKKRRDLEERHRRIFENYERTMIYNKFSIFDTYGMTREIPFPSSATDYLQHHYLNSVLESLVQVFLSLICPPRLQNATRHFVDFERVAKKMSCKRILPNPKEEKKENEEEEKISDRGRRSSCGCNEKFLRDARDSRIFCKKFEGQHIPFLIDS